MNEKDKKLLKDFLKEGEINKSEKTTGNYRFYIEQFGEFWNNGKSIKDMKRPDFIDYINWLKDRENSPTSISSKVWALGAFFTYLEEIGELDILKVGGVEISKNPFVLNKVKKLIPKGKAKKKDFLEPEEFKLYADGCFNTRSPERNKVILLIMVSPGGPRSIEILGIKVLDIDLETGRVELTKRKKEITDLRQNKGKKHKIPVGPKGGKDRTMRLSPVALNSVRDYIIKNKLKPDDWLFPFTYGSLRKLFLTLDKGVDCKKHITPHCLRATSAIWCLRNRVPEKIIMKLFGWDTRRMLDIYIQLDDRDIDREMERIFFDSKNKGLNEVKTGGMGY